MDDQIEILIKSFASKGKTRSEIVSELVHEGYNPDGVEEALNRLHRSGELPKGFWNGVTVLPPAAAAKSVRSTDPLKKTFIWIGVAVIVCVAAFWGWNWYQNQPRIVGRAVYDQLVNVKSFRFEIHASGGDQELQAQGIAVVQENPSLSLKIDDAFSVIQRPNENVLFQTGGSNILTQYGWISAPHELFFNNASRFNIQSYASFVGIIRDMSPSRGSGIQQALANILQGQTIRSTSTPPQGYTKGIQLLADMMFKKQLAELLLGNQQQLLDELAGAEWDIFSAQNKNGYLVRIKPPGEKIAGAYNTVSVTIGNFNEVQNIPFDKEPTPFEDVLSWQNDGQ